MSREPGTKVIERRDHGTRTINSTEVRIEELVWNGTDGRSWDVYRVSDDFCLTMDGSFDNEPDDDEIAELITAPRDELGYIDYDADPEDTAGHFCRFCSKNTGTEGHLIGMAEPGSNPWCCDDCWDERLR